MLCTFSAFSQVGIGTSSPTASLDINGDLRIRIVDAELNLDVAKDSILVVSRDGRIRSISSKTVIEKSLPSTVKGMFASSSDVNLSMALGWKKIPFDAEEFDTNDEYDPVTATFTTKQDGIYAIAVQIKANNSLGIANEFGVQIMKNSVIQNRNSYANVGVLGSNITSPVRNSQSLIQLNTGDTVNFEIVGDVALGSVNILGNNMDSFFSIHQIR
jgi:hypothetical protein